MATKVDEVCFVSARCLLHGDTLRKHSVMTVQRMVLCLLDKGFNPEKPLIVKQTDDFWPQVVDGHLRLLALRWLQDNDPSAYASVVPKGVPIVSMLSVRQTVLTP